MTEFSDIEQMYMKSIFEVHSSTPDAIVKTTQLAQIMGIAPASATEMVQRLSDRGVVTHIPYRGFRLTPEGFQLAARIKRREGLVKILLADVIGFNGNVMEAACRMEHAIDDDLEATLDRFLGYPEHDTDGNRIPGIEREIDPPVIGSLLPISSLPEGASATIEMLVFNGVDEVTLSDVGLSIGAIISMTGGMLYLGETAISLSSGLSKSVIARVIGMGVDSDEG